MISPEIFGPRPPGWADIDMAAHDDSDPRFDLRSKLPAVLRPVAGWLPGPASLLFYQSSWLRADLAAALLLLATVLPQSLAYTELAGLPGVLGVYTALAAMLVYALLGPTPVAMLGPDSALAVLTAAAVASAEGGSGRTVALASLVALMAGALVLGAGLARAGFLADLIAGPVLAGYRAGAALVIGASQLGPLLGLPAQAGGLVAEFTNVLTHFDAIRPAAVVVGIVCFMILLWLPLTWLRAPGPLLAVVACMVLVPALQLQQTAMPLAQLPAGFPIALPAVRTADVTSLLPLAALVALMALTDAARVARGHAEHPDRGPDLNHELAALGVGNVAASLVHGMPVTLSRSRTETAVRSGARTHLAGLICACLLIPFVLGPGQYLLTLVPSAALAAIVVLAAVRLFDARGLIWLWRRSPGELVLALAALAAVVLLGVLQGALVAVVLSGCWLLWRLAHPHEVVLVSTDVPRLLVYRMDAPLCFVTGGTLERRVLKRLAEAGWTTRCLGLDLSAVDDLDAGAALSLARLRSELDSCGVLLALAGAGPALRRALLRTGLLDDVGAGNVHGSIEALINHVRALPEMER
jgi:MFS superfamily sulfate permease-like transporter